MFLLSIVGFAYLLSYLTVTYKQNKHILSNFNAFKIKTAAPESGNGNFHYFLMCIEEIGLDLVQIR
jgi:hypothetical protein